VIEKLPGFANFRPVERGDHDRTYSLELYRSNSPERLTAAQAAQAAAQLDHIVDLRTGAERAALPHPLGNHPGYRARPLLDADLAPYDPTAGTQLIDLYLQWAHDHRRTLGGVVTELGSTPPGRGLFCCAAGKDRTGLTAALLARLRGASVEAIAADYAMTGERMVERFAAELAVAFDPPATRAMQRCDPETMTAFIDAIEGEFSTIHGYLGWLDVPEPLIAALLAEHAPTDISD
jgi:protein-tyrosine phosphatase